MHQVGMIFSTQVLRKNGLWWRHLCVCTRVSLHDNYRTAVRSSARLLHQTASDHHRPHASFTRPLTKATIWLTTFKRYFFLSFITPATNVPGSPPLHIPRYHPITTVLILFLRTIACFLRRDARPLLGVSTPRVLAAGT